MAVLTEAADIVDDEGRKLGRYIPEPAAPEGAPNVLLIVLDDVGYAQLGCYGSIIDTPNIDALAGQGVRLANFHTAALCSPTRRDASCLSCAH